MKETFYHLPQDKRSRIIESCIEEFGIFGYEKGSTDRIIQKSGISKGGLYEYISSKEELFIYIVDQTYKMLYDYIQNVLERQGKQLPLDILERFETVSAVAVDFYLSRPDVIRLIVQANRIMDAELQNRVKKIFLNRFLDIFGGLSQENLTFDKQKILELLQWMLLKTRNDFLDEIGRDLPPEQIRRAYLENWGFIINVFKNGIYKK